MFKSYERWRCLFAVQCIHANKFSTQTVSGGNTAEFYHAENTDAMKEGYNTDGTINKSQMLADMHPDVATVVWRYGRSSPCKL